MENTMLDSAAVKRGAARATRKHPAQAKLYQAGVTITALAAQLGEGRARVSAWFASGTANRPVPRRHAELMQSRYGIPLSDWARVADCWLAKDLPTARQALVEVRVRVSCEVVRAEERGP